MKHEKGQPTNKITADTTIDAITRQHPQAAIVLLRHTVNCVGCHISRFHNVATVSKRYDLELDTLLTELNEAIGESQAPRKQE